VIPPEHTAEFVAGMEDVLEVYRRPYDPQLPVICLDAQPTRLIGETRMPIPLQPGQAQRYDDEYERIGTANTFMIVEPLAGRRKVSVRATKTARDLEQEIKELLDVDFPKADKVVPVWDTLDTHAPASLYKAFAPQEARRLLDRLEIHDTAKHGSWLDSAEIALGVFTKPCLDRRVDDIDTLRSEAKAWADRRNASGAVVDWQFTTDNARITRGTRASASRAARGSRGLRLSQA
jgi:hypothetical protein